MQGVEDNVGLQGRQHLGQVAPGINARDPGDLTFQRVGTLLARRQRNLALGREPAHQDGDVKIGNRAGHDRLRASLVPRTRLPSRGLRSLNQEPVGDG